MESLENSIVSMMSQMSTDDHESLIRKFIAIVYPQIVPQDLAAFYMDLANWNLDLALNVFYDQNGDLRNMEEAFRMSSLTSQFLQCSDSSAVNGDRAICPGEIFEVDFQALNDGRFRFPDGTRLVLIDGDLIDYEIRLDTVLGPNEEGPVNLRIHTPNVEGTYRSRFQFVTPQNVFFGDSLWIILRVASQAEELPDVAQHNNSPQPQEDDLME
ncbi:unnamed protein product [Caenorhabditis angaria]|uniref:Nbr1 FW domain-containing protein n=1 Tax=Caenorhabditis angaria TaxID=860376 RepID=A0A9P1J342_9PELO|nr:unnamed protein product [Caenorhabditis angaria]